MSDVDHTSPPWSVTYLDDSITVSADRPNRTLLELSLLNKIPHAWECGGRGRCTTCRVRVVNGATLLSPRTKAERVMAQARGWDESTRLACQAEVQGDLTLQRVVRSGADATRVLAEQLEHQPGKEVEMAVLFCDLRNFTALTESHTAYDVVHILNQFYERIGEAIVSNNGYIFQYVGDEVVAWFGSGGGAPEKNSQNAVRAALGMFEILNDLNQNLEQGFGLALGMGIGIHHGPTIIGRIGHTSMKQLSAVGLAVNTASRIEALNRELGTSLLVSGELAALVPVPLKTGTHHQAQLRGRSDSTTVIEVLGFENPDSLLIVQNTLYRIMNDADRFGESFYNRLFEAAPEVRPLFKGDMNAQAKMFLEMLRLTLYGLTRFEEIEPGLMENGRRHVEYGVVPEHYDLTAKIFKETVAATLGDDYSPEIDGAWSEILATIIQAMLKGAANKPAKGKAGP